MDAGGVGEFGQQAFPQREHQQRDAGCEPQDRVALLQPLAAQELEDEPAYYDRDRDHLETLLPEGGGHVGSGEGHVGCTAASAAACSG